MELRDLMNRASLILGEEMGNESVIFYNEFVNYLSLNKPEYATRESETEYECENVDKGRFTIPEDMLFVTKIYKDGRRAKFLNVGNEISFFEKGKYRIMYVEKPKLVNYIDDTVTHNPDFDDCIIYWLCWKKAVISQYPQSLCNIYYQSFNDLFNSACKRYLKTKSNFIVQNNFL